jgi:hypothetical protein
MQETDWEPYALGGPNTTQVLPVFCSGDESWKPM